MKPGYKFSEGDNWGNLFYFSDNNIRRTDDFLNKIKPIADEKNTTLAQLVLRWTMDWPGITITLVGARNELDKLELVK
jgi:aryl-alcohol dehydrogenase-like predicted oxidoreductase